MHLCRDCQHTCHGMPVLTAILRLFFLLLLPVLGQAASLPLQTSDAPLLPGPVMHFWADPEGQADIHHVRQLPESAWQPVARRDASFGYSTHAYWLRFNLHNPADAPINRRGNPGEAQIKTGVIQFGLDAGHRGFGFCGCAGASISQFGRDGVALAQALAAIGFALRARLAGTGLLQLSFQAFDFGLERPWIDLEQQIAFLHQAAFGKGYAIYET